MDIWTDLEVLKSNSYYDFIVTLFRNKEVGSFWYDLVKYLKICNNFGIQKIHKFLFSFRATLFFPLWMPCSISTHRPAYSLGEKIKKHEFRKRKKYLGFCIQIYGKFQRAVLLSLRSEEWLAQNIRKTVRFSVHRLYWTFLMINDFPPHPPQRNIFKTDKKLRR